MQSGSYKVTARPASTTGAAPAGRRQINSQDTQTAGSVQSKSQAAYRHPTLSQSNTVVSALLKAFRARDGVDLIRESVSDRVAGADRDGGQ